MDKHMINREDELKKVSGGTDDNMNRPPSKEDITKAAQSMLRTADSNPAADALDILNGRKN